MHAMVLNRPGTALEWTERPEPRPEQGQIRVKVAACGVCRTDLHLLDGELPNPKLPIVPGHEIVGRIDAIGADVVGFEVGERVGIPWLGHTCGICPYCRMQRENLCDAPLFTGYTRDGGYATAAVADARFAFALGEQGSDAALAPLLCAGMIGWRSLVIAGAGRASGSTGSAPPRTSSPRWRSGRAAGCSRSREPAMWPDRGSPARSARSGPGPPAMRRREPLDAAIIFAPVGGSSRWRCVPCARAAGWYAPAFI